MKSLVTLSLTLASLLLYGCASSTTNPRSPAAANCHDATTNSEDHSQNHCNGDSTNEPTYVRDVNPRL